MEQQQDKRLVILDTETTGMPVSEGHRIIEIGCVEVIGRRLTGRHFHVYLQPDRESDCLLYTSDAADDLLTV